MTKASKNTPAITSKLFLNCWKRAALSSVANIFCSVKTAIIHKSKVGITKIILGALNLSYMGSNLSSKPLKPIKYFPQLMMMVKTPAAKIHHLNLPSNKTKPIKAKKQMMAPA